MMPRSRTREQKDRMKWRTDPVWARKQRLRIQALRYGLRTADVSEMKRRQGHRCAACRKRRQLQIDHDHRTGRIRKMLCGGCNKALGQMREDADAIKGLLLYVRKIVRCPRR